LISPRVSVPPTEATGTRHPPGRAWRVCRVAFRWFRIAVLLLVLCFIIAGLFLNHVGLPEQIKRRVVARLRAQGWDVEFSRLRLRWYRGIVAEAVHIQRVNSPKGPQLFVEEAEGSLNFRALGHMKLDVTALVLRDGRLILPFNDTNPPRQTLCLNSIQANLRFLPGDLWDLDHASATCLGAKLRLSGLLTNASALRDWRPPHLTTEPSDTERAWRRELWRAFQDLRFARAPEVTAQFSADARDTNSVTALLRLTAPGMTSPWGVGTNFHIQLRLTPPPHPAAPFQFSCQVRAGNLRTRWGQASTLLADAQFEPPPGKLFPTNATVTLDLGTPNLPWGQARRLILFAKIASPESNRLARLATWRATAEGLQSRWGQAERALGSGWLTHPATNLLPASFAADLEAARVQGTNGSVHWAQASVTGALPTAEQFLLFRTNLLWPDRVTNIPFRASVQLSNAVTPRVQLQRLDAVGSWSAPRCLADISAALYGGTASVNADLDTATRELRLKVRSRFDPHSISHLLDTNLQTSLATCAWEAPPHVQAEVQLVLPAWTNRAPAWQREVLPTLSLQGAFDVGGGTLRAVPFSSARSSLAYSNGVWRLQDLSIARPEGALSGELTADTRTRDFRGRIRSTLDPQALKPLIEDDQARQFLDEFQITTPPVIAMAASGNWREPSHLSLSGDFAASNFVFRGEAIKHCATGIHFTNQFLGFLGPQVQREGERGQADGVGVDLGAHLIHLTNAAGNLSPYAIARVIGPHVVTALEPYVFDAPPTARAWGVIDMFAAGHRDNAHFELSGGPFRWRKFRLPLIDGRVDWVGETVTVTNIQGDFYGGRVAGNIAVNFAPTNGDVFAFSLLVTNADLHRFMNDVASKSNRIEGTLSGALVVFYANVAEPRSWQGNGQLNLTNGLIWDIPIFGLFSPVLNAFVPGLGNSRAKRASATFTIANSVIHSRDLQINATGMRMQYDLRVDFDERIEGRVEAELLRNIPGLGVVISKILWPVTKLFEYRLSGTLDQPKASPVFFIPRILLLPFRPIKTIEELLPEQPKKEAQPPKP
jgi:hypothetical protein